MYTIQYGKPGERKEQMIKDYYWDALTAGTDMALDGYDVEIWETTPGGTTWQIANLFNFRKTHRREGEQI